jgi:large repetitive protein
MLENRLESLEGRTLLSYTFVYTDVNNVTVNEAGGNDSFTVVNDGLGFLEYSIDGGGFTADWDPVAPGVQPIDASALSTVNIVRTGDNSAVQLGDSTFPSPASANLAHFDVVSGANTSNAVTIDESGGASGSTYDVDLGTTFSVTGPGINFTESAGISQGGITLFGADDSTTNVLSTFTDEPVSIVAGTGANNIINVGNDPGTPSSSTLASIHSLVTVSDPPGLATLHLLDAGDVTSADAIIEPGTVTGLGIGGGGSIVYAGGFFGGITTLVVDGGTNGASGITYFVIDTTADTTLNTSANDDTVNVFATGADAPLTIHGFDGRDKVNIGFFGSVLGILGDVTIDNFFDYTDINLDASFDTDDHEATLSGESPSTLTGLAPADIIYTTGDVGVLKIDTGPVGNQVLNVDFSTGNPIPAFPNPPAAGLVFNAGADFGDTPNSHALNIVGTLPSGEFAKETHNANDLTVFPHIGQYGSIAFVDSFATETTVNYTGLLPINDTAGAVDYVFNDFADDNSFTASDGLTVLGFDTIQFVNTPAIPPPTFETTNVANKTNITFNTTAGVGLIGVVNITTPSTGLATLTFNTITNGKNEVSFINTPPGVVTTLNGGTDEDVTNVTGQGVAASTTLFLNGNGSPDTLNYDAGGSIPAVTSPSPGVVLIELPGFGSVNASGYQIINIDNVGPIPIIPGPEESINTVEGFNLVDAIVGTFTAPLPPIFSFLGGLPASVFTAALDWRDPSSDLSAGTITQDAGNPSVYYITGTHTFPDTGSFTVDYTVTFSGATLSTTVDGATVTVHFAPSGPSAGTPASATVTEGPLFVSVFPIVGIEGRPIPAGPIATFVDAGGADLLTDYSATIDIFDSSGALVVSVPAASITQNSTAAQYTVNAPAFTLLEEGTYQVVVSVTDSDGPNPLTVSGASSAVIADAKLTSSANQPIVSTTEAILFPVPVFNLPVFNGPVASFTDANPGAAVSDFSALIDWGDGTPMTAGKVSALVGELGTEFIVSGKHTYADSGEDGNPGTFPIQVFIVDEGGARLIVENTAHVLDNSLDLTGQLNPSSDSGVSQFDGITNINQPNFFGTVEPFAHVALSATPADGSIGFIRLGQTQADSSGAWSITSNVIPDGRWVITANAVDQLGRTTDEIQIMPSGGQGPLVVDTVSPRITDAFFDRLSGQVFYSIQDASPASGVNVSSLIDSANYQLTTVHASRSFPGRFVVTEVFVSPGLAPNSFDVAVTFNSGKPIKGGFYLFTIRDTTSGPASVQDIAGNHLDGEFYGSFPSGNGIRGGDFVAEIDAFHHRIFAPQTIVGTANPGNEGIGGPRQGPVHGGGSTPVNPRQELRLQRQQQRAARLAAAVPHGPRLSAMLARWHR